MPLTHDEHKKAHRELHKCLDNLIADYLIHHPERGLNNSTIMDLLEWSYIQTLDPTPLK